MRIRNLKFRESGFTLIELTMSMVIVSILLLALGSTLSLTLYATNNAAAFAKKVERSAELTDQLTADLGVAQDFTERTATSVAFTVPDRDGDGAPDLLRYALSGNLLTRQYQANAAVTIGQDVQLLNLTYQTKTIAAPSSTDTLLSSFDNPAIGSPKDFAIDDDDWAAEYFVPALPAGTTTWSISRVRLRIRNEGANKDGIIYVQLRVPAADKSPSATVVASQLIYEVALADNFQYVDVPFNVQALSPSQALCITVGRRWGSSDAGRLQYQEHDSTILSGSYYSESGNDGSSWNTPNPKKCMRFSVYGTAK